MKLDGMTIPQLRDLKGKIDEALPKAKDRARDEIFAQIEIEAQKRGLSVKDVIGAGTKAKRRSSGGTTYTNPKNPSQTWSGMGRPPLWLTPDMRR